MEKGSDRLWQVGGLIIGPRLPRGTLQIGPCTIYPATQDDINRLQWLPPPNTHHAAPSPHGISILPIRIQVKSHHIFLFEVTAETQDEALLKVDGELKKVLAALTLAMNNVRYYAKVLSAIQPGDTSHLSVPSDIVAAAVYNVQELEVHHKKQVERLLTAAENKTVAKCLQFLNNAWQLWDAVTSAPVHPAILQNYFFVLETISDKVTSDIRKSKQEEMTTKQASQIRTFIKESAAITDDKDIISTFRNTWNGVLRTAIEYQSLALTHSGHTLRLNQKIINDAVELNKIRNQILSHPRSSEKIDLNEWLYPPGPGKPRKAEAVCSAYLIAYIEYLDAKPGTNK